MAVDWYLVVFNSNLTIIKNDNINVPYVIQGNKASHSGRFISCYNANIEIQKYNFIGNNAEYGGVFHINNSILRIIGNDNGKRRNKIYYNEATTDGGFICAYYNSIIEIDNYLFFNNTATSIDGDGGAFLVQDSSLTLNVRDDPSILSTFEINKNNINIL